MILQENNPAQGCWFTLGGRVLKHESIEGAIERIKKDELGIIVDSNPKFLSVFEHLYDDSIFEGVSTHYLNLGYELEVSSLEELMRKANETFDTGIIKTVNWYLAKMMNTKDYFTEQKGTVPQKKEN